MPPPWRARTDIERPRLLGPLVERPRPLAVMVAPAGWGKSTLLQQWRVADRRPFATVALSAAHDDPAALTAAIAAALLELQPRPAERARAADVEDAVRRFATLRPSVLALDRLDALRSEAALGAVARLTASVPSGTTLALLSRRDPDLPFGRLRAEDGVTELRTDRLGMTRTEAVALVRATAPMVSGRHADRLFELTGGWPAALRLALRAITEQGMTAAAAAAFAGDDSTVAEYVGEEVLAGLTADDRAFLRRVAIVEVLTGPACDAALGGRGSATRVRRLARSGVPLVPVDRAAREHRMNPLLAQALVAELRDAEPELEPELHRRLSRWHESEGDVELAIEHAVAAREPGRAGALLGDRSAAFLAGDGASRVEDWLRRLGDEGVAGHPALSLAAALAAVADGRRDDAERWTALVTDTDPQLRAGATVVQALCTRGGVDEMAAGAGAARAAGPRHGAWFALTCLAEGAADFLAGRPAAAQHLDDGARAAAFDAPLVRSLCRAVLALVVLERGDAEDAAALAARARGGIAADHRLAALTLAVSARLDARSRHLDRARRDFEDALRGLAALDDPPPWYSALTLVTLAHVAFTLRDAEEGRRLLAEASRLRRQDPAATALKRWIEDGWALADDFAAGPVACPATLTMAELRVLRLLPSHLSLREIGARLHISPNTVKSQAHAIYRKLGARSRSEAVARAAEIGLVEAHVSRAG